ncbi:hypothetical protein SeMB42_g06859 [Synchytrium endobioticum]|uniref:Ribosomal L1 domain-containing protein 1 n=1 Tax=Synchytrium endobioticum TaxID=286115 RepID=A0A507CKC5_9FUNG|nr:hypothetical protein SeMB42_g06859 [Synchytrium endobioticum]TPX40019.1 hypothetical protein SeLEV6574_g06851 [Synchytrium endobioticum]
MDDQQVSKAARALLAHIQSKSEQRSEPVLLDDGQVVWLIVTTKRIPAVAQTLKPIRIPLKHSILPETAEICLITKDPQREYKDLLASRAVKVSKVIGISKVKARYKQYEAKRAFASSYHLFLADDRIVRLLPPILGKAFYSKKKQPIPINLAEKGVNQIEKAKSSTYLHLTRGCCNAIKIGTTQQSATQITENILHAIPRIVAKIPSGWPNIQSIHIKTAESVALPLYAALPDVVGDEKEETSQERRERLDKERQAEIDAEPTEEDKEDLRALMKVLFPVKKRKYASDEKKGGKSKKKRDSKDVVISSEKV